MKTRDCGQNGKIKRDQILFMCLFACLSLQYISLNIVASDILVSQCLCGCPLKQMPYFH
jgi:hypothetical protein